MIRGKNSERVRRVRVCGLTFFTACDSGSGDMVITIIIVIIIDTTQFLYMLPTM